MKRAGVRWKIYTWRGKCDLCGGNENSFIVVLLPYGTQRSCLSFSTAMNSWFSFLRCFLCGRYFKRILFWFCARWIGVAENARHRHQQRQWGRFLCFSFLPRHNGTQWLWIFALFGFVLITSWKLNPRDHFPFFIFHSSFIFSASALLSSHASLGFFFCMKSVLDLYRKHSIQWRSWSYDDKTLWNDANYRRQSKSTNFN